MGGGDLNMKKSFHPNTMANLERVFNAELKRDTEMKKVEQLRREIADERQREEMHRQAVETGVIKGKAARLDWMYSGPGAAAGVDREEYLLGKKIDKEIDPLQAKEEEPDNTPGSMYSDVTAVDAGTQRDMAAKIREDPLFAIKKQEEQARKNLMSNPVRLKQLQDMLRDQTGDGKKKKKKSKQHKRDRHGEEPSPADERSRHAQCSPPPRSTSSSRHSQRHYESRDSHGSSYHSSSPPGSSTSSSSSRFSRHHCNDSRDRGRSSYRQSSPSQSAAAASHRSQHDNDSRDRGRSSHRQSSPSQSAAAAAAAAAASSLRSQRDDDTRVSARSSYHQSRPENGHHRHHHPDRSPVDRSRSPLARHSSRLEAPAAKSRRLDPEEAERRRQAMMAAASQHHKERDERVRKRKEATDREEAALKSRSKKEDEHFLATNTLAHTSDMSVEEKIKRNINRVQRTKADLDRHFMKR